MSSVVRIAAGLALAGLVALAAGCSTAGSQLGQVNQQLGTISSQFTDAIKSQTAAIESQKQVIASLQTSQKTVQVDTVKTNTVLQKDATAVVDLLRAVPTTGLPPRATAALAGALAYATATQTEAGGVYMGADRVDAAQIATGDVSLPTVQAAVGVDLATYTKAHADLVTAQTQLTALQARLTTSEATLQKSDQQLVGANSELRELRTHITWEKMWDFMKTPLGLVIGIGLIIAFPALIPIIGAVIGHIISLAPALMSFFGVASKKTIQNVATGVGNFKDELDKLGADAQVKVSDVKAILGRELSAATDSLDRRVIDHVRNTKNVS